MNYLLAVDYQTDWTLPTWWIHYGSAIAVPMIAAGVALASVLGMRAVLRLALPNLAEAAAIVVLAAAVIAAIALGVHWHIELLYETLRHTSTNARALTATLIAAGALSAYATALAFSLGVRQRIHLAAIGLLFALPALFSLSGDALTRQSIATAIEAASLSRSPPG